MTVPNWVEPAFVLVVCLALMHYVVVFYVGLFKKLFGLFAGAGGRLTGRRVATPVSYRRNE